MHNDFHQNYYFLINKHLEKLYPLLVKIKHFPSLTSDKQYQLIIQYIQANSEFESLLWETMNEEINGDIEK
jgi:hypothetical protein